MRRMLLAAVALLAAAGFLAPGAGAARQEPPAALDVPADEECQGDPQRSVVALFSTPEAATPAAASTPFAPPVGQPADEATAAAMTATIRAVVACINAGDYFPVLSLVSDGYLRDRFAPGVPTDPLSEELRPFVEALRGCQTCEVAPIPEQERFGIVAVEQPQSLDGGRAGAFVRLSTAADPGAVLSTYVAFVPTGDRLVVDEIVDLAAAPPTPTP